MMTLCEVMMKNIAIKILLLTLFLAICAVVQNTPLLSTGFIGVVVCGFLGYCGIIVVAHLIAACHRFITRTELTQKLTVGALSVVDMDLDAETEAI